MTEFGMATVKREGTTVCRDCWKLVGEGHENWCPQLLEEEDEPEMTYGSPRITGSD